MTGISKNKQLFFDFIKDKRGNIAILAAFALLPIMIGVGAAIDYSRIARVKSKISQSTDAASLSAAASVMKDGQIKSGGELSKAEEQKIAQYEQQMQQEIMQKQEKLLKPILDKVKAAIDAVDNLGQTHA